MPTSPLSALSRLTLISIVSASVALSGCGSGVVSGAIADTSTTTTTTTANLLEGVVYGGQQPVAGSNIQLFAASTSGKGSAATLLLSSTVVTDANGTFTLSGMFTCAKSTDQVYLIATGGNPGPTVNTSHALMSALGNCGNLKSSTPIAVNEVTTIASVYALAPYMNTGSYDVASNSGDAAALTAAFALVRTLANLSTGTAIASGSIRGTPILNKLNSLADSVASCIDSTGSIAPCPAFFIAATPPSSTAVPTNTIAAILDIALNPTNNVTPIYNLAATAAPFQPSLSAPPYDWTLFGSSVQTTPVITWANPAPITFGTTLSATQLNATASVPGSFLYSPAAGTTPAVGTDTLSVTFTPTDTTDYSTATASVSLVVNKVTPTTPVITWANPAPITFGTTLSATQLNATASVPGSFLYSPAAGTTPAVGTDTLSVTFTPTDTTDYSTATASVSLVVNKVTPTTPVITWANPAPITFGTTLSATQLNATASVPGSFLYSPAAGTTPAVGTDTLSVTFTPTDTTDYSTATASVSLVVNKVTPTTPVITWANPAPITFGTTLSATQLNATASVPGSFLYSPAAGTTPAVGTDTLSVTFTPTDTTDYSTATASVSLVVNKVTTTTPVITWANPAPITFGTTLSATQLNATASVPGSFLYSPAAGTTPAVGTDTLSVTFTPTDTTDYSTATASVSLVVNKVTPTTPVINWANPAPITFGTTLSATQLNATASVPGSFLYSPAAGTTPAVGTDTLSVTFTPTDTTDYSTATASVTLVVNSAVNPLATNIAIDTTVKQTGLKRLGINIVGQDYYDSGQMLRNLTFRNPGFEGETWQSILQCAAVTATSCTDRNQDAIWPVNFLQGAQFEFIYGSAMGSTGTVTASTAANYSANQGVTISFAQPANPPAVGDWVIVKMSTPGNAQAGWWADTHSSGATFTTDLSDLSPNTPGKQALNITAAGSGQEATVHSYFDSYPGHAFVQLNGAYQIFFRAKGLGGSNQMTVSLVRYTASGNESFLYQTVTLTAAWQDYTLSFSGIETGSSIGTVDLSFDVSGANVLLDDVSLTPAVASTSNPTAFRDEVVSTMKTLNPGVVRYMDSGNDAGSSIDNMIAVPFARVRAGASTEATEQDDVTLGLHEFLQLCQVVGAEPWYTMPAGMSPTEMQNLIEYLGGDASTPYGAKRSALGQAAPWTSVFPVIHLELGNEQWNAMGWGATITDPIAYGNRIATIFGAARSSASYNSSSFDLVMGSWAAVPWWTSQEMANSANYDTVDVAPYLFNSLNDTSSNEAIFGPMFAQPESVDSVSSGYMAQQAVSAAGGSGVQSAKLAVYEVNLSTVTGTASQSDVSAVVPSVATGLTVADHMLLMMRDLGIKTQNLFSLPGIGNQFNNTNGGSETTPLFGAVVDMGGNTNLRRPVFLAEQLVNTAIMSTMLTTTLSGANPTWNQALSTNDSIQLAGAHELQSFAFSDGSNSRSLVVFNLSRSTALPVTFSGVNAPFGTVAVGQLTSANLTDTNETAANVNITNTTLTGFTPGVAYSLPPFSMTVFTWLATQ